MLRLFTTPHVDVQVVFLVVYVGFAIGSCSVTRIAGDISSWLQTLPNKRGATVLLTRDICDGGVMLISGRCGCGILATFNMNVNSGHLVP